MFMITPSDNIQSHTPNIRTCVIHIFKTVLLFIYPLVMLGWTSN